MCNSRNFMLLFDWKHQDEEVKDANAAAKKEESKDVPKREEVKTTVHRTSTVFGRCLHMCSAKHRGPSEINIKNFGLPTPWVIAHKMYEWMDRPEFKQTNWITDYHRKVTQNSGADGPKYASLALPTKTLRK